MRDVGPDLGCTSSCVPDVDVLNTGSTLGILAAVIPAGAADQWGWLAGAEP